MYKGRHDSSRIRAEEFPYAPMWFYALLAVLTAFFPLLVPALTPHDDRLFMYPYGATLELLPLIFCLFFARRHVTIAKARWILLAVHFGMRSLSLWSPTLELWIGWPSPRESSWLISGFISLGSMFCLLTLTSFSGNATKAKRLVDATMSVALCVMNFTAAFSKDSSGFSTVHVQLSFFTAAFLLLGAEAARRSAMTSQEQTFTDITTVYLASRVVTLFFINIVDHTWMAKPRDLPFNLLFGLPPLTFSLVAIHRLWGTDELDRKPEASALVGSLLPSMVLLASVALALRLFSAHPILCSTSIGIAVVCFVLRTHLLYQRMLRKHRELIERTVYLEEIATHDSLTGIRNRRWLEERAFKLLEDGEDRIASLLLIDIDHFKIINDTYGHKAGDELLQHVGEVLSNEIEAVANACCARIGGDEFVVLLPDVGLQSARAIGERIREHIRDLDVQDGYRPSISMGVAAATGHAPLSRLLELADEALYRAKECGRDMVVTAAQDGGKSLPETQRTSRRRFRERR